MCSSPFLNKDVNALFIINGIITGCRHILHPCTVRYVVKCISKKLYRWGYDNPAVKHIMGSTVAIVATIFMQDFKLSASQGWLIVWMLIINNKIMLITIILWFYDEYGFLVSIMLICIIHWIIKSHQGWESLSSFLRLYHWWVNPALSEHFRASLASRMKPKG